ncbi:Rz1 protein precursor-related protein [Haloferax sp. KTX1]|uniref:Rz1 protein precursor-related protein n=1 Tax=Haloferax sp. KTX1 TaxID=2600597 RepID=UPI0011DE3261|nr:Rz1 protein precursor-related protein [Haloferax sp. KTX1]
MPSTPTDRTDLLPSPPPSSEWLEDGHVLLALSLLLILWLNRPAPPDWPWALVGVAIVPPWLFLESRYDDWRSWVPTVAYIGMMLVLWPRQEAEFVAIVLGQSVALLGWFCWRTFRRRVRPPA